MNGFITIPRNERQGEDFALPLLLCARHGHSL